MESVIILLLMIWQPTWSATSANVKLINLKSSNLCLYEINYKKTVDEMKW